jgi:hypothetical protein
MSTWITFLQKGCGIGCTPTGVWCWAFVGVLHGLGLLAVEAMHRQGTCVISNAAAPCQDVRKAASCMCWISAGVSRNHVWHLVPTLQILQVVGCVPSFETMIPTGGVDAKPRNAIYVIPSKRKAVGKSREGSRIRKTIPIFVRVVIMSRRVRATVKTCSRKPKWEETYCSVVPTSKDECCCCRRGKTKLRPDQDPTGVVIERIDRQTSQRLCSQ